MAITIETIRPGTLFPPADIKYFHFGSGKETMVILPGMSLKSVMDSAEFIASAYSIFADMFTVYVFGIRDDIPDSFTPADIALDTAAAMLDLGLTGTYMFGVSLGGIIAQIIAAKDSVLVRKLALCSTAERLPEASEQGLKTWIELARQGKTDELVTRFAEAVYSDKLMRKSRSAFSLLAQMITAEELERFIVTATGLIGFDTHIGSCELRCPVLVTGGAKDRLISREALTKLAHDTNAELYIYEDGAHSIYDEIPDHKQRLLDFFIGG